MNAISYVLVFLLAQLAGASLASSEPEPACCSVSIKYKTSRAKAVTLVWGIDEWQLPGEDIRPSGSEEKEGLLYTPMRRTAEGFAIELSLKRGTKVDYVFKMFLEPDGTELWDTNSESSGDFYVQATGNTVVSIEGALDSPRAMTGKKAPAVIDRYLQYFMPQAGKVELIWGVDGWRTVPESLRLPGTGIASNGVMLTPMQRTVDGVFVGHIRIPENASVQAGFRVTKALDGRDVVVYAQDPNKYLRLALWLMAGVIAAVAMLVLPAFQFSVGTLNLHLDLRRAALIIGIVGAVTNVALIVGSLAFDRAFLEYPDWDSMPWLMREVFSHVNVGSENVAAVWYSSMLFLAPAILAVLCFVSEKTARTSGSGGALSYGWLIIAAIFAALSLSETGSLHERIGKIVLISSTDQIASLPNFTLVPILLFGNAMLVFVWSRLKNSRRAIGLVALGMSLYLLAFVLDNIDLPAPVDDRGLWLRHLFLTFEEGGELFGSLAWTLGLIAYLGTAGTPPTLMNDARATFGIERPFAAAVILCMLWSFGLLGIEVLDRLTLPGDRGIARNWFPASLCAITALLAYLLVRDTRRDPYRKFAYMATCLFAILTSLVYGTRIMEQLRLADLSGYGLLPAAAVSGLAVLLAAILMRRFRSVVDFALLALYATMIIAAALGTSESAAIKVFAGWLAMFAFLMRGGGQWQERTPVAASATATASGR